MRAARSKPRLLFLVTEDWAFCSHRLATAQAAKEAGYEVWVATRVNKHGQLISKDGFHLVPICMQRSSLDLKSQWQAISELIRLYRIIQPDIVHHVAMKPILYGSIAAFMAHVPAVVNMVTGLGFIFTDEGAKAYALRAIVQLAIRSMGRKERSCLILQNTDDARLFMEQRAAPDDRIRLIRGSGVDIAHFQPLPEPNGKPTVAIASRMLRDKGIIELVEAVRILHKEGLDIRVILAGSLDRLNPSCLCEQDIRTWEKDGLVEWWGEVADIRTVWMQAHIAALPSYREGLPKSLLEAAACGRALVATDVPGCREITRNGENGLLVPARDAVALAAALRQLVENPALRQSMGSRGREIVEKEFSVERVVNETLAVYQELLA